jgi:WD40 repeat protein/serine/threonine protein kinase
MDKLAQNQIKGYELKERIGEGGFGAVYRAFQNSIGREVAVKIILPKLANQSDFIRRFEGEAQLVARLEHPHITPLYDYWRDPEGAYLVMRWLRGGSLRESLDKGAFELRAAALLLDQVAGALSLAHRNGIIHRDIKPANILLDEDGNAYLTDFGIAKDLNLNHGNNTQPDVIVGSLDYISPEQARSEPVSSRTDIYSLGVTLYEMIVGRHPFENMSPVERLFKHINDPLPHVQNIEQTLQAGVNDVIQKATAKNPAERYPDALAFAADFREACGLNRQSTSVVELLTQREQEILQLIIEGLSNKEIAQKLVVTLSTVKWYVGQIYDKLGVRSRVQAIVRARELNLIVQGTEPVSPFSVATEDFQPENPYKGLRAFQASDNQDFFGREKLIAKLMNRMSEKGEYSRFLAVVGPSGSGKSSLVKAGLIPALWRGGIAGSEKWFVVEMLPSARPLDELEIALMKVAANHAANLKELLHRDAYGLARIANLILPNDGSELVLVIDQFEEVFTMSDDEAARQQFLDLLYAAVTDARSRVRVIMTLRADFYDRPLHYNHFGEMIRSRLETILPLSAEELQSAIHKPAERVGLVFEEGLVASMVANLTYQPGALPLLQYALTELFEHRKGRLLSREAYETIGKSTGAVARRADEIYEGFDEAGKAATKQLFLRLVTVTDGADDTRRRVSRMELLALGDESELIEEVIDTYSSYRLLTLDNDPISRTPTVELAHEAILREWQRLREWLNESRDELRIQRQVSVMTKEWTDAKRDKSFLARGIRLERFGAWVENTQISLTPIEREFISKSIDERQAEAEKEAEQQARETVLKMRSQRFLQGLVTVLVIATLGAFALSAYAFSAQQAAEAERDVSQELAIVNGSQLALSNNNGDLARALANVINLGDNPSGQAQMALGDAMYPVGTVRVLTSTRDIANDENANIGNVSGVVFSPDSQSVFVGDASQISQWNIQDGSVRHVFEGHEDRVLGLAVSPNGQYLLSGDYSGVLILWDVASGDIVKTLFLDSENIREDADRITATAFDPTGTQAMVGQQDGSLLLLSIPDLEISHRFEGHTDTIGGVAISPDGQLALSGSFDTTLRLWNFQTKELIHVFSAENGGHTAGVTSVAFSPDSRRAVSGSYDVSMILWDLTTKTLEYRFSESEPVSTVAFSADGTMIISGAFFSPTLWHVESKSPLAELAGHSREVFGVAFSPDGQFAATRSLDRTIRIWDVKHGAETRTVPLPLPMPIVLSQSSNGRYFLLGTGGLDAFRDFPGEIILYDVARGERIRNFGEPIPNLNTYALVFSPDSRLAASSSFLWQQPNIPILTIWDVETGEALRTLNAHTSTVYTLAFSPDGRNLLSGSETNDAAVLLWDVETGEMLRRYDSVSNTSHGTIRHLIYGLDGTRAYIGYADGSVIELELVSGNVLRSFGSDEARHTQPVGSMALSPDGQSLVTGSEDAKAILWNLETGQVIHTFVGHLAAILDLSFSPDGRWIFSVGDSYVMQWDVASGEAVRRFPHFAAHDVAVSLDGQSVYSTGFDFVLRTWRIDSQEELMAWAASHRFIRELSCTERALYRIEPLCDS